MKKLGMFLMLLLAMTIGSHKAFAQSVTITMMPGWNWISVPLMDTLDFETALGSFTPMSGDVIKSQWSNATYMSNGQWRGPISQFYPGYGYMYYSNRPMPVMVTFTTQQPAPQVVVTTSEPMLITAISAMCGGEVTVSDGTYIIVKGLCWATHENPTTNDDFYQEAESGVGSFSISMPGLNISTTYYVRAYAVTPNGTIYGDQKTFTTQSGIPTLTTAEVTSIGNVSAICGGIIISDGGLITTRGVCWSTTQNPNITDAHTSDGFGLGNFNSQITGLMENTTYYVRAYASNSHITVYGDEVNFTTLNVPVGAIGGLFSVSDSIQVYFSQGNLQYQPSTNTWRFAENQYDMSDLGEIQYNIYDGGFHLNVSEEEYYANDNECDYISYDVSTQYTATYSGWIDLFGWGTSGYHDSGDPYNVNYQPWSTSSSQVNSSYNYYGYGPSTNMTDPNLTGISANYDWGVYNPISNGGNVANQWRTLTQSEWDYVFNTRTTTSGIRYARAKVNNVYGVILLPDDWSSSIYNLNNINDPDVGGNTLTVSQWGILEQAGAVFLPRAGYRSGTVVIKEVSCMDFPNGYWSASYRYSSSAYGIGFYGEDFYYYFYPNCYGIDRSTGQSVRLVRDVE